MKNFSVLTQKPILSVWAIVGLVFLSTSPALAQGGPAMVTGDRVVEEEFSQTAPTLGRFIATRNGNVTAAVEGPVEQIMVEVGDRVAIGDVLARLELDRLTASRDLRAAAEDEADARLRTANAEAALRRAELNRLQRLRKSAAFNQARYEDAQLEVNRAVAEIARATADRERARAELRLVETDLAHAVITAPFPGVITQRHTELGDYVRAGDPIVSMLDDATVEIEADVPFSRVDGLKPGLNIEMTTDSGLSGTAMVRAVVPVENPLTRTRPVRFVPEMPAGVSVATDQSVTLNLPVGAQRSAITVHKDAINRGGRGDAVFVDMDGKASPRPVTLGVAVGNRLEVLNGLAPGEWVVVRGNERLRPGQDIVVTNKPKPDASDSDNPAPTAADQRSDTESTQAAPQQAQNQLQRETEAQPQKDEQPAGENQ